MISALDEGCIWALPVLAAISLLPFSLPGCGARMRLNGVLGRRPAVTRQHPVSAQMPPSARWPVLQ